MKRAMVLSVVLLLLMTGTAWAENSRRTTEDAYGESFETERKQPMMSQSAAEARAEAYRKLYAY